LSAECHYWGRRIAKVVSIVSVLGKKVAEGGSRVSVLGQKGAAEWKYWG
jgi:hypothetical protein